MKENKEHLWHAYLDGELSAIEAVKFEASLTDAEQARLAAETRFERALAERLSEGAECPDDVWERTRALITRQEVKATPTSGRRRSWYWGAATLTAAAGLAFVISMFATPGGPRSALVLSAATVNELAATSEVQPGSDFAEQFIRENGIDLKIQDDNELEARQGQHQHVRIVGARQEPVEGGTVIEVLVDCCGFPVKIVFADVDSSAAREIGLAAAEDGDVLATRVIGDYMAAVVSRHESHHLLNLFSQ